MDNISINPIVYLIFTTFVVGFCFLKKTKLQNRFLFYILLIYTITELFALFFNCYKISVGFLYNISIILQFMFWLLILSIVLKKQSLFFVYFFIAFATLSLFYKFSVFNNFNFVFGAILYLILYVYENYNLLNQEKIEFFQSNNYFLISIPIIFFLGMSFLFSFNLRALTSTIVVGKINLYTAINYFVNIIYYILINIYIYKEKSLQNE